jgi:hypothetical protein
MTVSKRIKKRTDKTKRKKRTKQKKKEERQRAYHATVQFQKAWTRVLPLYTGEWVYACVSL